MKNSKKVLELIGDLNSQDIYEKILNGRLHDLDYPILLLENILEVLKEYKEMYNKTLKINKSSEIKDLQIVDFKDHYFEFVYRGDYYEISSKNAIDLINIQRTSGDYYMVEYIKEEVDTAINLDEDDFDAQGMSIDTSCYVLETYYFDFIDGSSLSVSGEYYGDVDYNIDEVDSNSYHIGHLLARKVNYSKEFEWDLDIDELYKNIIPNEE